MNGFPEIPKGRNPIKIWYNPAIIPLYAVLGLATYNMCYFMHKYFTGSTEVNWDKKLRMTHDNQGVNPHRTAVQNKRPPPILWFGGEMMGEDGINKKQVRVFPFNYIPMADITNKRLAQMEQA